MVTLEFEEIAAFSELLDLASGETPVFQSRRVEHAPKSEPARPAIFGIQHFARLWPFSLLVR